MGLMDLVKSYVPARSRVGRKCSYGLTELGKQKAEEFEDAGTTKWKVLNYLDDNGVSSLREICEGLHLPEDTAKELLRKSMDSGYALRVTK